MPTRHSRHIQNAWQIRERIRFEQVLPSKPARAQAAWLPGLLAMVWLRGGMAAWPWLRAARRISTSTVAELERGLQRKLAMNESLAPIGYHIT